ncbi:MAG: acireductone synthase [Blastocatellia bacterium]
MAKAILLDIEGTTTPIDFVHKTLFPYAKARMAGYVGEHFDDLAVEIEQLRGEHEQDADYGREFRADSPNSVADYLVYLIEKDRKSTPLKAIQGMIWQQGYESGDLVSIVYEDVPIAMKRCKDEGKIVAIYSSGSVLAQMLIFKYSDQGDLAPFISNYFDTNVGHKREVESYRKIRRDLDLEAKEVLFVSDVPAELDAASEAGMQTALSIRKGNAVVGDNVGHFIIRTFDELPS